MSPAQRRVHQQILVYTGTGPPAAPVIVSLCPQWRHLREMATPDASLVTCDECLDIMETLHWYETD